MGLEQKYKEKMKLTLGLTVCIIRVTNGKKPKRTKSIPPSHNPFVGLPSPDEGLMIVHPWCVSKRQIIENMTFDLNRVYLL